MISNVEKGNNFEFRIASLYEFLGFKTYRNREIQGQQIDIIAEKDVEGVGEIKLIIECKFLSRGSVANQVIYDFRNLIFSIKNTQNITKGIIVTNRSFSKEAYLAAGIDGQIELRTENELELKVFDLRKGYLDFSRTYESDWIFKEYIPLKGSLGDKINYFDLEHELDAYISNKMTWKIPRLSFLSLFGDFGSGKSTTLKRILYKYSIKYLDGTSDIKPFFFELKHFYNFNNLDLFITHNLKSFFYKDLPLPFFWKEIDSGKAIILLDGFDEMAPQVNQSVRMDNFLSLTRLLGSKSPSIISCRPSYFISSREYSEVFRVIEQIKRGKKIDMAKSRHYKNEKIENQIDDLYFQLKSKYINIAPGPTYSRQHENEKSIFIANFSSTEINKYLALFDSQFKVKCNSTYLEVLTFLESVYDLSELMSKPLLLKMVKDTMLELGPEFRNLKKEIGPHYLYELYTQLALDIENDKGETRQFLESRDRKEFAEAIALAMFEKEVLEVEYYEILEIIRKNSKTLSNISKRINNYTIEEIASDIQICSFITRTDNDTFKFVHKSFMEFFVARIIKETIYKKNYGNYLMKRMIPKEILYFVGSYIMHDKTLSLFANEYFNNGSIKKNHHKRNLGSIILLGSISHQGLKLEDVTINHIDIKKSSFKETQFKNINFDNVIHTEVIWDDINLNNVSFVESKFINFNAIIVKGYFHIYNCYITKFSISNIDTLNISSTNSFFDNGTLQSNLLNFSGKVDLENVNIKVSMLELDAKDSGPISFKGCEFLNIKLKFRGDIRFNNMSLRYVFSRTNLFSENKKQTQEKDQFKSLMFKQCDVYNFTHKVDSKSDIQFISSNSNIENSDVDAISLLDIKNTDISSSNFLCQVNHAKMNKLLDNKLINSTISIQYISEFKTYEDIQVEAPIISGNFISKSIISYFSLLTKSLKITDNNIEDSLILGLNVTDDFFKRNKLRRCRGYLIIHETKEKNKGPFNWKNESIIEVDNGLFVVNIKDIRKEIKFKEVTNIKNKFYTMDYIASHELFIILFKWLGQSIKRNEEIIFNLHKEICLHHK